MRPSPRGVLPALALLAVLALAPPAAAQNQQRLVTIAARSCPSYPAITANRARNNIMESLKDLGANTPYGVNGVPFNIDPAIEANVQPLCTPIRNWAFTLGTGYKTRAVDGVWGSLSKVTGDYSPTIWTANEPIPLLNGNGQPDGQGTTIDGARTITLTTDQATLAASVSKLWIQGGTPTVPITNSVTYAFGALRCATDNLNGDNVEWISYPPNTVHVFCFAYYVQPAPTSGTITVVKQATLPDGALPQEVRFVGDISFDGGQFSLTPGLNKPDSKSFIRAAGSTWNFAEQPPPLATLTDVTCAARREDPNEVPAKPVTSSWTINGPATAVALGAGDHVTCTYTNRYRRPATGLAIRKVTLGGTGTSRFGITGEGRHVEGAATTETPGLAVRAEPAGPIADLPAGTYKINEQLPPDIGGTWTFERVSCLPAPAVRRGEPVEVTVPVGPGTACTFFNRFTPAGHITLHKVTLGGVASTRFQVRPTFGDPRPEREQLAVTTEAGEAVTATGDRLTELPIGRYEIQETIGGLNRWEVARVECDGELIPSVAGMIAIELTAGDPEVDCTFVNRRIPDVVPPDPPAPTPVEPPGPPAEVDVAGETVAAPVAELRVAKRVAPGRIRLGGLLRYTVTVVNRGPDPAAGVTLGERGNLATRAALPLRTADGTCRKRPPRYCAFGTLAPGETATVRLTVRPTKAGRYRNAVAVNTATQQQTRRGKRASVRAVVRARAQPRFTG